MPQAVQMNRGIDVLGFFALPCALSSFARDLQSALGLLGTLISGTPSTLYR
jgi:hypothetical protein